MTCGVTGIRDASAVSGKLDSVKAADRERRNAQVLQLHLSGATYRAIADTVGLRSPQSVRNIVARGLAGSALRRELLASEAFAVWLERQERLWRTNWGRALDGDYRAAELCRKLLAQWATVFGLGQEVCAPATKLDAVEPPEPEPEPETGKDGLDMLARMRRDHARALGGVG